MGNADSKSTKAQEPPVGASSPRTGLGGEISLDKERRKKKNDRPEEIGKSKRISDDQVQVNLAMADLMAYLQVVANNSNHLPSRDGTIPSSTEPLRAFRRKNMRVRVQPLYPRISE